MCRKTANYIVNKPKIYGALIKFFCICRILLYFDIYLLYTCFFVSILGLKTEILIYIWLYAKILCIMNYVQVTFFWRIYETAFYRK